VVQHFVILLTDVVKTQKNHSTVTYLNRINFVNLFYSFIFQQSLIKIYQLFPNCMANYQNPYFMHLLHEIRSFFILGLLFLWLNNHSLETKSLWAGGHGIRLGIWGAALQQFNLWNNPATFDPGLPKKYQEIFPTTMSLKWKKNICKAFFERFLKCGLEGNTTFRHMLVCHMPIRHSRFAIVSLPYEPVKPYGTATGFKTWLSELYLPLHQLTESGSLSKEGSLSTRDLF